MASPAFKNLMMILLAGERLHVRLPLKILGRLAAAGNFVLLTGHKLRLQIEAEVGWKDGCQARSGDRPPCPHLDKMDGFQLDIIVEALDAAFSGPARIYW